MPMHDATDEWIVHTLAFSFGHLKGFWLECPSYQWAEFLQSLIPLHSPLDHCSFQLCPVYIGGLSLATTGNMLLTFSLRKNLRCSLTVSRSNKMLCWGQTPRLLRIWSISVRILCPLIVADPPVGVYRPTRMGRDREEEISLVWLTCFSMQLS